MSPSQQLHILSQMEKHLRYGLTASEAEELLVEVQGQLSALQLAKEVAEQDASAKIQHGYMELDPKKVTAEDFFQNCVEAYKRGDPDPERNPFYDAEFVDEMRPIFMNGMASMHYLLIYFARLPVPVDQNIMRRMLTRFEDEFKAAGVYEFVPTIVGNA